MKTIATIAVALALAGCAGLQTDWVLQMQMRYSTPADKPAAPAAPPSSAGRPA